MKIHYNLRLFWLLFIFQLLRLPMRSYMEHQINYVLKKKDSNIKLKLHETVLNNTFSDKLCRENEIFYISDKFL